VNRLSKDSDVWSRTQLLIPFKGQSVKPLTEQEKEKLEEDKRRRLVQKFKRATKTNCDHQALYYLDSNGFHFEEAIKEYNNDLKWEISRKR
jgi:hypothetical protein